MTDLLKRYICFLIYTAVALANQCDFPSKWLEGGGTYMLHMVDKSTVIDYITYNFDGSSYTKRSNNNIIANQYNCPAYSSSADGTQVLLRSSMGRQDQSNGLCISQIWDNGVLIRREAGVRTSIADCKTEINKINLYDILLPVDVGSGNDWSIAKAVDCPLPSGAHLLSCQLNGNVACPPESRGVVTVQSPDTVKSIIILANGVHTSYTNLPLTGKIQCIADLSPTLLGEPTSNDRVLLMKWTTKNQPNRVFLFCARYIQLPNNTYSISMDVHDPDKMECLRGATHASHQLHQAAPRKYFKMHFQSIGSSSTLSAAGGPTPTQPTPTQPTPTPNTMFNLQTLVSTPYDSFAEDVTKTNTLKEALKRNIMRVCAIHEDRLHGIYLEKGTGGKTIMTAQIEEGTPSVDSCKQKINDFISKDKNFLNDNEVVYMRRDVYVWTADANCPDIKCKAGTSCWIRQGDRTCECATNTKNSLGKCPSSVSSISEPSSNQIITFSIVGVAVVFVIVAIIVTVIFVIKKKRAKDNDSDRDSIGSLEQQDRDMYSSIGKKPTAFHDKSFMVDDDDDSVHGEKTGIHSSAYM